jgi:putative ABC transport system permease protein
MVRTIEGEYFDALGIPLLRGRPFTSDDGPDTEPVAIISQSLAAQVYGDGEPLGERFRTGGREFANRCLVLLSMR